MLGAARVRKSYKIKIGLKICNQIDMKMERRNATRATAGIKQKAGVILRYNDISGTPLTKSKWENDAG